MFMLDMGIDSLTTAQAIQEIIKIAEELNQKQKEGQTLGLSPEEMAFYNAICENKSAVENMQEPVLIELARMIRSDLAKLVTVDWTKRENVLAKVRLKIKRLLKKYKYPPDEQKEAIELVLQQAMVVGKSWNI